jgi:hypothetical protein
VAAPHTVIVREGGRSSIPAADLSISNACDYWIPRLRGV